MHLSPQGYTIPFIRLLALSLLVALPSFAAIPSSPLSPSEEQATFKLPPGFVIELVASEEPGIGKFVAVDWDLQGRMWSMTALEYPVDANEDPATAEALYRSIARDKIVFYNAPFGPGPHPARVFADGLAIPLGILPYKNGVYVQHGTDIVFLSDTNSDGRADRREVILSGFGVQDSHLFPHQFTRAPGNWIWMAQGAFNYGKVKTTRGVEQQFDRTRMASFRYDGSDFEITSQGPCNIWGLVINGEGEAFIQEANDYGYPVMPFHRYANYPGCSDVLFKSYAPEFPGTAEFRMGGTGLSGLALSDARGAWPAAYANIFYIANPITGKIQMVKAHPAGPRYALEKLPDFVSSTDEWFRPVAIRFGPDGCLYIVDWYNKIISHNEVPRNHPERDKKRGRIWRVRHAEQTPFAVPNFLTLAGQKLVEKLGGDSLQQSHLAWQAITDRELHELVPDLVRIVSRSDSSAARRIAALWALEGLRAIKVENVQALLADPNRNIRREAIRSLGEAPIPLPDLCRVLQPRREDPDPEVRAEIIRTIGEAVERSGPELAGVRQGIAFLIGQVQESLAEPTAKSTHNGRPIKVREAYDRAFERYLVRLFLEKKPELVAEFLRSPEAGASSVESRMLAAAVLEPLAAAEQVARLLDKLTRHPTDEELITLVRAVDEPEPARAFEVLLKSASARKLALASLLRARTRLDAAKLEPILTPQAESLLSSGDLDLAFQLTAAFKLTALGESINDLLTTDKINRSNLIVVALRALREINSPSLETFARFAESPDSAVREEAILALASSKNETAPELLLRFWTRLNAAQRRLTLDRLAGSRLGANTLAEAIRAGRIESADIDGSTLDKLVLVLPKDSDLSRHMQSLSSSLQPVLRLTGANDAWLDSAITLQGPFSVESWVKLDPGIGNEDGILGAPGALDMNFFDRKFRVWIGGGTGDAAISRKPMTPNVWTHLAVTRSQEGNLKVFLNGEWDNDGSILVPQPFENCRVGWSAPNKGTAGWLTEFRVWDYERHPNQIRAEFDRTFVGEARPKGLLHYYAGSDFGKTNKVARVERTSDVPTLLTASAARAQAEIFSKFRAISEEAGNSDRGKQLFTAMCQSCHSVEGQGGQIGPILSGAGAMGVDGLLRALLTPNAAMEAGYRTFRVELADGDILDGLLVSEENDVIVLRRPNIEDERVPRSRVKRASYTKISMMPEGLLEPLEPKQVADLFAYLKTLK